MEQVRDLLAPARRRPRWIDDKPAAMKGRLRPVPDDRIHAMAIAERRGVKWPAATALPTHPRKLASRPALLPFDRARAAVRAPAEKSFYYPDMFGRAPGVTPSQPGTPAV
jgi:hypothetical protein